LSLVFAFVAFEMPSGFFCFLKVNFGTVEMFPLLAIGATYMAHFLLASTDVAHV